MGIRICISKRGQTKLMDFTMENDTIGQNDLSPHIKLIWNIVYLALYDYVTPIEEIIATEKVDEEGVEKLTEKIALSYKLSAMEFFFGMDSYLPSYIHYLGLDDMSTQDFFDAIYALWKEDNLPYYQAGRAVFPKMSIIPRSKE